MRRPLEDLGYDLAERDHYLADDAAWRSRSGVSGGPLRKRDGTFAPVPAWMRLDRLTNRNGPIPEHRPDLGPCWVFTGGLNKGYGYIGIGKRTVQAYRVNYERYVGPIPEGAIMDHLCRVRSCVHPLHVEPTTYSQNALRSPIHPGMVRAAQTHCPAGHPYDEENTYLFYREGKGSPSRVCRACARGRDALRRPIPRPKVETTHCPNGHERALFAVVRGGRTRCRECERASMRRHLEKTTGRTPDPAAFTDTHCRNGHERPRGAKCPRCNADAQARYREARATRGTPSPP